jgi:nitrate/nitrite transporter NarK
MAIMRRTRGVVLRVVRSRQRSIAVGLVLLIPAVWLQLAATRDAWWSDAISLVGGATGAAFLWTGLTGASPDWVDGDKRGS